MLRFTATLSGLALLSACAALEPSDSRPNVVLVVVDTLRADHLGSYGFRFPTSPRVDALAAQGALFERAIAAAPSTLPSHAAILTSRYAREIGAGYATGEGRVQGVTTLATAFRAAGYATGAFVSNIVLQGSWGFDRGFDVYDDELVTRDSSRHGIKERIAEVTTRRALNWSAGVRDRPFLLWVHYQDPHGPYGAPPPFGGKFSVPAGAKERPLPVLDTNGGLRGIPAYQAIDGVRLPSEYRSRYADEIHYADRFIGELVDAVERHPSGRDLVFLLTSDHGEAMGEEGRWFVHGFTTKPQLAHVPFIVRAPGVKPGRYAQIVSHVDVMPTLLELAQVEFPMPLGGVALGPLLREGRPLPERDVYCDRGREVSAYRKGGFLRVTGIRADAEKQVDDSAARWERWSWEPGGRYRLAESDLEHDPGLRAFVRSAVRVEQPALDAETEAQLRALGYLEGEGEGG